MKTYSKAILVPIDYYHTLIRKQCPRKTTILENILKDSTMSPATKISHVNDLLTQQRTRRQPGPVKKTSPKREVPNKASSPAVLPKLIPATKINFTPAPARQHELPLAPKPKSPKNQSFIRPKSPESKVKRKLLFTDNGIQYTSDFVEHEILSKLPIQARSKARKLIFDYLIPHNDMITWSPTLAVRRIDNHIITNANLLSLIRYLYNGKHITKPPGYKEFYRFLFKTIHVPLSLRTQVTTRSLSKNWENFS